MEGRMKVELPLKSDSYNSYPHNEALQVVVDGEDDVVFLQIGDRRISVCASDLMNVIKINIPIND
jgi:hypothetical protein